MGQTTFSGPVRSGYEGGGGDYVIDNTSGTEAYGFYSRIEIGDGWGSNSDQTPGTAYSLYGRVQGGSPFSTMPTTTANHVAGVYGNYAMIGSTTNTGLKTGVLATINTNVLGADAACIAFMQGDSGVTTCTSAFGVAMVQTTPGSGFDYGLDLKMIDVNQRMGGGSAIKPYAKANIRMEDDVCVLVDAGAPTSGASGTGDNYAGTGSLYVDSTAGKLYINTGTISSPTWTVVGTQT